jgi:uncharacterized damage-inducible protein DinB
MSTTTIANPAGAQTTQIIQQLLNTWTAQANAITKFFDSHPESFYESEVAPGRNRAIYLLGHLVAASDGLFPLLGFGERNFPELEILFSTSPDRTFDAFPGLTELKQYWQTVNTALNAHFAQMSTTDWLERHTRVSAADFANEPTRNKLNVLISRTNHISYHLGQLVLLLGRK